MPCRPIASSSTAVPVTLTSEYMGRSDRSTPSPTMAAWWHTASTPVSASSTAAGSRTSPSTRSQATCEGRPLCTAGVSESRPRTSWPASRTIEAMCDPMKPAAPVTSTRMTRKPTTPPDRDRTARTTPSHLRKARSAPFRAHRESPGSTVCRHGNRCRPAVPQRGSRSALGAVPDAERIPAHRRGQRFHRRFGRHRRGARGARRARPAARLRRRVPRRAARGEQQHRLRHGRRRLLRPR